MRTTVLCFLAIAIFVFGCASAPKGGGGTTFIVENTAAAAREAAGSAERAEVAAARAEEAEVAADNTAKMISEAAASAEVGGFFTAAEIEALKVPILPEELNSKDKKDSKKSDPAPTEE